ncbi:MAG: hypothetical protein O2913_12545 [Chloroflexi bacterium]|nr:hypothetical protein [Chloroflexota bacterium]
MHSPDNAEEVAEARRIGGLRRRREVAVSGAYEFDGLETVAGLRRLLMIAALDTLGLENSIARARTLIYLVGVAGKLLETGELEQRIAVLEGAIHRRNNLSESLFDAEPAGSGFSVEVDP